MPLSTPLQIGSSSKPSYCSRFAIGSATSGYAPRSGANPSSACTEASSATPRSLNNFSSAPATASSPSRDANRNIRTYSVSARSAFVRSNAS